MVLFLFLDEALGEYGTQRWVGEIKLNNQRLAQAMPLTELLDYVQREQAKHGWKSLPPGKSATSYRIKEPEGNYLRSDVFVGTSMHFRLVREYREAGGRLSDPLAGTGADFVFVAFPADHLPRGEEVAVRGRIEEALDGALQAAHSGRLLGGSMGRQNAYIDLLLVDGARSMELLREVLRSERLPPGTSIHYFAKEKLGRRVVLG
jgi:hypothetical protein